MPINSFYYLHAMELVSIIMPVKNAALFLDECLDTILHQTHDHWELIAVDDHSTDLSKDIILEYVQKDPRIHCMTNKGQGIIDALQTAYKSTTGTFITRMDADDKMPENRLEKMVNILAHHPKSIATGLVKYFGGQPISKGYLKYEKWINNTNLSENPWDQVYRECVIASPNWMIRKSELDEIGGFDDLTYPEDYHLVFKWYQNRFEIRSIPEVTLYWREHPDRTSRNSEYYAQKAFFELKIKQFIKTDLRSQNLILWGKNEKTTLTAKILEKANIPFQHFDLTNYKKTEFLKNLQILVGVYPDQDQRKALELYLSRHSLSEGADWWYI